MKVGIDAKWFFTGPPSTRTILENLLPRLVKFYPEHQWIIFLDKNDKHLPFPLTGENIRVHYAWANNNMLSNLFILPSFIRKSGVEVMVFQTFPTRIKKVRSIAFIHDVLFKNFPRFFTLKERLYFRPLSWFAPKANRLMATSEYVAASLVKYRYAKNRDQIDLVTLGINEMYKPVEQHAMDHLNGVKDKWKLPAYYILYVGRINSRKNLGTLLKAIPLLKDKEIVLVIVGQEDGKPDKHKTIISELGIDNRVIILDRIPTMDLSAIYAMAKLFCFPSFAEGFGLPPLEAMASGIPVIVSNSTAMPEVCGNAAIYIDPNNDESIAGTINELLDDQTLYLDMKKRGLLHAASFSWDTTSHLFMQSVLNAMNK